MSVSAEGSGSVVKIGVPPVASGSWVVMGSGAPGSGIGARRSAEDVLAPGGGLEQPGRIVGFVADELHGRGHPLRAQADRERDGRPAEIAPGGVERRVARGG